MKSEHSIYLINIVFSISILNSRILLNSSKIRLLLANMRCLYTLPAKDMDYFSLQQFLEFLRSVQGVSVLDKYIPAIGYYFWRR